MRGWKNMFCANGNNKKAVVAILMSDKTDIKTKSLMKDKERYYITIKGSIQEKDIINIYKLLPEHLNI